MSTYLEHVEQRIGRWIQYIEDDKVLIQRMKDELPEAITSLDYSSTNLIFTPSKKAWELSITWPEDEEYLANLFVHTMKKDLDLQLDPKTTHDSFTNRFERSGAILYNGTVIFVELKNLPKPPKCKLIKHTETREYEHTWFTAECEDEANDSK